MNKQPTDLKLVTPDQLQIAWSDGEVRVCSVRELREKCPCAFCVEKRSAPPKADLLPILSAAETAPLRIIKMEPKGRYAYAIDFSDGHDTGIYTLELLNALGTKMGND